MSNYSTNKIFTDASVNAMIDRIYYELTASLPDYNLNGCFCLTGRAAAILQGAEELQCDNIIFITNEPEVYGFILNTLPKKIQHSGVLKFKERAIYQFSTAIIEFWFDPEASVVKFPVKGVYVQSIKEINPILL
jgi:hypothetical protein